MSNVMKKFGPLPKTFDEDFNALAELVDARGWSVLGVDGARMKQEAADQKTERSAFEAAHAEYLRLRWQFKQHQDDRGRLFASVVAALRQMFRNDADVMAVLRRFKRNRKAATEAPPPAAAEPATTK